MKGRHVVIQACTLLLESKERRNEAVKNVIRRLIIQSNKFKISSPVAMCTLHKEVVTEVWAKVETHKVEVPQEHPFALFHQGRNKALHTDQHHQRENYPIHSPKLPS